MTQETQGTFTPDPKDFSMPNWLIKSSISTGAKLTYMTLTTCAGGKTYTWPSQEFLSKAASVSVRTVQRHLKELSSFGLIRIGRREVMGTIKTVYYFLNHALMEFGRKRTSISKQAPKMVKEAGPEGDNLTYAHDKNSTTEHDKNASALNKVEGYKSINKHPLPPTENLNADQLTQQGENYFLGDEKNPIWEKIKCGLTKILSASEMGIWIDPLKFELNESLPILRFPNQFFMDWVKKNFKEELILLFQKNGFENLRFELFTEEQRKFIEEQQAREAKKDFLAGQEAKKQRAAQELENLDALTPEEQFARLWEAYPVKKEYDKARRFFLQLSRCNERPKLSVLLKSVKNHQRQDRWWREHMPPLLVNWLKNKKWLDKPYE